MHGQVDGGGTQGGQVGQKSNGQSEDGVLPDGQDVDGGYPAGQDGTSGQQPANKMKQAVSDLMDEMNQVCDPVQGC